MKELQIPISVSKIITEKRHLLSLSLEDPEYLKQFIEPDIDGYLKGTISPVYLLSLNWTPPDEIGEPRKDIHIFGTHELFGSAYATSRIAAVSPDLKQIQTQSGSIYDIRDIRTSEPPPEIILHICYTLHFWQLGEFFGVLDVFY